MTTEQIKDQLYHDIKGLKGWSVGVDLEPLINRALQGDRDELSRIIHLCMIHFLEVGRYSEREEIRKKWGAFEAALKLEEET